MALNTIHDKKTLFWKKNSIQLAFDSDLLIMLPYHPQTNKVYGCLGRTGRAWPHPASSSSLTCYFSLVSNMQPLSNILQKNCFQKGQQKTPLNPMCSLEFSHNFLKTNSKKTTRQWHLFQHFWIIQRETENERLLTTVKEIGESDTY